ncbi:hypothetical protein PO124_13400 [Bacillus licheniformis]|nr:hypothetical protein [Bacillus licheniformis]
MKSLLLFLKSLQYFAVDFTQFNFNLEEETLMVNEKKISSGFIYFLGLCGHSFGYDIGVMTGALPFCK